MTGWSGCSHPNSLDEGRSTFAGHRATHSPHPVHFSRNRVIECRPGGATYRDGTSGLLPRSRACMRFAPCAIAVSAGVVATIRPVARNFLRSIFTGVVFSGLFVCTEQVSFTFGALSSGFMAGAGAAVFLICCIIGIESFFRRVVYRKALLSQAFTQLKQFMHREPSIT